MGNANSSEIEQLKQLYSMNNFQLEALRKELVEQKRINQQQESKYKQVISNLLEKQNGIKNKIPDSQFSKVNDFLTGINREIESKNSGVQAWKPGDNVRSVKPEPNINQQRYAQNQPISSEYSGARTQIPKKKYENIKKSDNEIDPYALYGFVKGEPFTMEKLKETYKKYALQTHPDVEGGSERNFAIINNAYKFLVEEFKKMENDRQYNELKMDSVGYIERQEKSGKQNRELSGNFNVNKFNQVFQDNIIEDTSNEGYNAWLQENQYDTEDIQQESGLTTGNFNSQFESRVKTSQALQRYVVPQELNSRTGNVQELGVERVDNYSGESGKIRFTDLKEAHTTSRLVDPNTKYVQHKNLDSIKSARSNMGNIPREQQDMIEQIDINRKRDEAQREESQRRMDRMYAVHHDRMNNIFLGGGR